MSFVLLFLSGGIAFMTSGALDTNITKEKLEKKMERAQESAKRTGKSVEEELGIAPADGEGGSGEAVGPRDLLGNPVMSEDVPEEVREAFGGGGG